MRAEILHKNYLVLPTIHKLRTAHLFEARSNIFQP